MDIGYVVHDKESDSRKFRRCFLSAQSGYWNTKEWSGLFSVGRKIDDFKFVKDGDGVKLKVIIPLCFHMPQFFFFLQNAIQSVISTRADSPKRKSMSKAAVMSIQRSK